MESSYVQDILFNKKYRLLRHIAFWFFIYADELLSLVNLTDPLETENWRLFLEVAFDMSIVYFNIYYLLPKMFFQGKYALYLFWTFVSLSLLVTVNYILYYSDVDQIDLTGLISLLVTNASLMFMAVAMKLIQSSFRSNKDIQKLKEDQLQAELAYLRTQVNPHFLFNTLNNMYVMARKKDDELPETIMQLSDLLRYQLYDCDAETILLKKEIEYLKNYIQLEEIRRKHLNVEFNIEGEVNTVAIRPLILLPFIENAFKHASNKKTDTIIIHIAIKDNTLVFKCSNTIDKTKQTEKGIGNDLVKNRLQLLYGTNYELAVDVSEDIYRLNLSLPL